MGTGTPWTTSVPVIVNQTKLSIVTVMQTLDRPVTSSELQAIWAEPKALEIFEYHLCTLVKAKVQRSSTALNFISGLRARRRPESL